MKKKISKVVLFAQPKGKPPEWWPPFPWVALTADGGFVAVNAGCRELAVKGTDVPHLKKEWRADHKGKWEFKEVVL